MLSCSIIASLADVKYTRQQGFGRFITFVRNISKNGTQVKVGILVLLDAMMHSGSVHSHDLIKFFTFSNIFSHSLAIW